MDDHELLDAHPLVASLRGEERQQLLDVVTVQRLSGGTTVLPATEHRGPLVLLLEGRVQVLWGDLELAVLEPGTWVGELALLDAQRPVADVVALDDLVVGRVEHEDAHGLLEIDAIALQLDVVARSRRATNRAVAVDPVQLSLRDGGTAHLRPVWPADWRMLATGDRERVSPESLRMRFFTPPPLTERTFRRLTSVDLNDQYAWAAVVDGQLSGIGRYALTVEDRGVAELAVLVADDQQGRGLGRLLVTAVVVAADVHGADELLAIARAENAAIRHLLDGFGADFAPSGEEGVVKARWSVAEALTAVDESLDSPLRDVARVVLAPVVEA